jgi:hypothetical protein
LYDGADEDEDTSIVDPAMEAAERREVEVAVLVGLHEDTAYNHNQETQKCSGVPMGLCV